MRSSLRKVWRPLHENLLRRLHEIKYWGIDQKWAQDCDEDVGAHNWRHVDKAVYVSARLRADWRRGNINNAEKMWPLFADLCCTSINASQIGRIATVFERSGGIVANKILRNTDSNNLLLTPVKDNYKIITDYTREKWVFNWFQTFSAIFHLSVTDGWTDGQSLL